jgi:hypothetical protein
MKSYSLTLKQVKIPVLAAFLLVLASCTGNQKTENRTTPQTKSAEPGWVSLFDGETLNGWEVTNFGTQGPVRISGGNIVLGMGDGCTGITWKSDFPTINYEVQLEAKKITGNDFFCGMTFPVDESFCSLIIGGWGGPVVGLSNIDGYDASENETRTLKKFEHDTWYHIHLKVTPEKIEAWINEEKMVDFATENRKLSIRPEVELSKPFGICSWVTTAALRNIQVKPDLRAGH